MAIIKKQVIYIQCPQCNGMKVVGGQYDGVISEIPCPVCNKTGEILFGRIADAPTTPEE